MFKALTPLFAIILALGLVFTHVRPTFSSIKAMQDETADYVDAIAKAEELKALITEKLDERDRLDDFSLERLALMLPEDIDELALILSLDALATEKKMSLSGITIAASDALASDEEETVEDLESDPAMVGEKVTSGILTTIHRDISFSLEGTYKDFRIFIESLEESLVLFEVMDVKFDAAEGDTQTYTMTVRAFALESQK